jgi:glycerophosphoryl diester phosphodiesterase
LLIIAHRTCPSDAAENSIEGIARAFEQGADAVEVDLRLSADLQPFLMHDITLRRTTGYLLPLELTTSKAVARRRVLASGLPVPSLAATLDALPAGKLIAVDVKTPWALPALAREVRARGMDARVLVWCASFRAARYSSSHLPRAETAYLKTAFGEAAGLRFLSKAVLAGASAVSAHWLAVDRTFVERAHARGLKVYSWHQEFPLTAEKLRSGLDGLITDYPLLARRVAEAVL